MQQQTSTRHSNLPGYGLIFGTAAGTMVGIFLNEIALGAAFGSAIGLVFGAMLDLLHGHRA